jgi:hypothetical protein
MNTREIPRPGRSAGYRKASEVNTFLFCRRAWWFERQGAPSEREPERAQGTAHHQRHGERVGATPRVRVLARLVLALAVALLLFGLWLSVP